MTKLASFVLLLLPLAGAAQDSPLLRITVVPRIVDGTSLVIWEQKLEAQTLEGRPVVVNLQAGSLKLRLTITPFGAPDGNYLIVVQGLVRQDEAAGTSVRNSVQSLVVPAGEKVIYFPLGRDRRGAEHQMVVEMSLVAGQP